MKKTLIPLIATIIGLACSYTCHSTTITVIADASWKVTGSTPSAGWESHVNFDDTSFSNAQIIGQSAFQDGAPVAVVWNGPSTTSGSATIWLRKKFVITGTVESATLDVGINDDVLFYINGQLALNDTTGVGENHTGVNIASYLQTGTNLFAAVAKDTIGPEHALIARAIIQVDTSVEPEPEPEPLEFFTEKGGSVAGEPLGTTYLNFGTPSINEVPELAFYATITGPNRIGKFPAILYGATPQVFVRKGDQAPALGGAFLAFKDPLLNDESQLAFLAQVQGSKFITDSELALFTNLGGTFQLVAHEQGMVTDPPDARIKEFKQLVLTNQHLVFLAELKIGGGDVSSKNNLAVWSFDKKGKLQVILRKGALINGKRVESFLLLNPVRYSAGQNRAINSRGELAARLTFTDGTQGLMSITIP